MPIGFPSARTLRVLAWRKANPEKYRAQTARYRERHRGQRQEARLRSQYGITADERARMLECQGGLCAGCRIDPATDIDHDHKTGKVRELLCHGCNAALGFSKESPERLERLAAYARKHRG